jgi:hypothetical protein
MRRRTVAITALVAVAATAITSVAPSGASAGHHTPPGPPDTSVAHWDAVGIQAFSAAGLTPPDGHTIFGYVAIAVYDAVMAIEGGYEPFAVTLDAPAGASAEAAVAAAAHGVLAHYLPAQRATILDPALTAFLAGIQDGSAEGVAVGAEAAAELIALRADDGFRSPASYTPPNPPVAGAWIPTAPTPPIGAYMPNMQPFSLKSNDQFRPDGPPPLDSKRWGDDYNEVAAIGAAGSSVRSADQTVAARFWAEPPVQQARGSFRKFVLDHQLDVVDAARFMAMMSVTVADSIIVCFAAKYDHAFWRPVTAIRAGDTDPRVDTIGDPAWTPLIGTPNHPEYPSAHSCITPPQGQVIARFLGTNRIDFTVPSLSGNGDRSFERPSDLAYEVANARIWGGIHYRDSVEDGTKIGHLVANWVLAHHFHSAN